MIHQLRVYQLFEDTREAFHERFRDHALPIMARHGFRVLATWDASGDDGPAFAYLLEWPDIEVKEAVWSAFMADEEWAEIKRVTGLHHGRFVGAIEDRVLQATEYSPASLGISRLSTG